MLRWMAILSVWACLVPGLLAAEKRLDFADDAIGKEPKGFKSLLVGGGAPGDWKVVLDEGSDDLKPLTQGAPATNKRRVLAQVSRDKTDERFPLLVYEEEKLKDFTLTLKLKTVEGEAEQMAGVAFRLQDEKNYYAVRISSLGNNLRFYRVQNGFRDPPIGPSIQVPKGVWHELKVECKGNRIRLKLNGNEAMPEITDSSFSEGRVGFWTKSDAVSYFTEIRLDYIPREYLAKAMVRETMQRNPRLVGMKIFARRQGKEDLEVVASSDNEGLGVLGTQVEKDAVAKDAIFYGRTKKVVTVTLPLHDRNGDPVAAVRVDMTPFPGQTEANAVARAVPIIRGIEGRVKESKDLTE